MCLYRVENCFVFTFVCTDSGFQRVNMFLIGHFCSL